MASWSQPLVLLQRNDATSLLEINEATITKLCQIDKHLSVISVAGAYRTGKSYLLSRLIKLAHGNSKGFEVRPSSDAVTKGIWVYYMDNPRNAENGILLLDTEGLGDPKGGDENFDYRILCISILLGSNFLYNQNGEITKEALKIASAVSNHIDLSEGKENSNDIAECFPTFTLVVRNFQSELVSTPTQYMDQKLFSPGKQADSAKVNTMRNFQRCFTRRDCFLLPVPGNSQICQRLNNVSDDQIEPEFIMECNNLYDSVIANASDKIVNKVDRIKGLGFALFIRTYTDQANAFDKIVNRVDRIKGLETYTDQINAQKKFRVYEAIKDVGNKVNAEVLKKSIQEYRKRMRTTIGSCSPTAHAVLESHKSIAEDTVQRFLKEIMDVAVEDFSERFKKNLRNAYEEEIKWFPEFARKKGRELTASDRKKLLYNEFNADLQFYIDKAMGRCADVSTKLRMLYNVTRDACILVGGFMAAAALIPDAPVAAVGAAAVGVYAVAKGIMSMFS